MTDQPRAEAILRRKARSPGHGPVRRIDPATGAVIETLDVRGRSVAPRPWTARTHWASPLGSARAAIDRYY
jgi:hypothetical protein